MAIEPGHVHRCTNRQGPRSSYSNGWLTIATVANGRYKLIHLCLFWLRAAPPVQMFSSVQEGMCGRPCPCPSLLCNRGQFDVAFNAVDVESSEAYFWFDLIEQDMVGVNLLHFTHALNAFVLQYRMMRGRAIGVRKVIGGGVGERIGFHQHCVSP